MKNLQVLFTIFVVVFCFTSVGFTANVSPQGIIGPTFPEDAYHYATIFGSLSKWIRFPDEVAQKVGRGITSGSTLIAQNGYYDYHRITVDQMNDRIVVNVKGDDITFLTLTNRHSLPVAYATLFPPFEPVMALSDVMAIAVPAKPLVNFVFPFPSPEFDFERAEIEILVIQGETQTGAFVPVSYDYPLGAFVSWFSYQVDLNPFSDLSRSITIKSRLIIYNELNEIVDGAGITTDVNISETLGGELMLLQRKESLVVSSSNWVPERQDVVRGASEIQVSSINFDNSLGLENKDITRIKLSGYVSPNFQGPLQKDEFSDGYNVLSIKDLVNAVSIYEVSDGNNLWPISSRKAFNTAGEIEFTDLHWLIPAGKIRTLVVVADINSYSLLLDFGDADLARFAVGIANPETDVFCTFSYTGNIVKVQGDTSTTLSEIFVHESGLLSVENGTVPISADAQTGSVGFQTHQLKFSAEYEDLLITRLRIVKNDPNNSLVAASLAYINENGQTVRDTKIFFGNNADFSGIAIPVYKDRFVYMDISVNVAGGAIPGSKFSVYLNSTEHFEAVGLGSSSAKLTYPTKDTTTVSNTMTVVGVLGGGGSTAPLPN